VQDEPSLIRRAQQRDQVALNQLYETHFDRIYRYIVLKIGDRTEAEDMTQQVFLNALQSISSYRSKGLPFSSWLYRIAHNPEVLGSNPTPATNFQNFLPLWCNWQAW
jgi:RNA polymerase sigma-70 factor (ECF subfamily)